MNCQHCGAENPENAVFCMACGARVDGKVPCPSCGALNSAEAVYCIGCGKRLDGKLACPDCGAVNESGAHFCYACGHDFREAPKESSADAAGAQPAKKKCAIGLLTLLGGISAVAAAAFACIFTFCIGLVLNGTAELAGSVGFGGLTSYLYDYFGPVYEQIGKALPLPGTMDEYAAAYTAFSLYFPAVLGTVLSAGVIVSVPLCTAIACVRFARAVRGSAKNTDFVSAAAGAVGTYFAVSLLLLVLNFIGASTTSVSADTGLQTTTTASVALNGATVAGIVLSLLFLVAAGALCFSAAGKEALAFRPLFRAGASLAGIVCLVAITALAGTSGARFTLSPASSATSYFRQMSLTVSPNYFMAEFASLYASGFMEEPVGQTVLYVLAVVSLCALLLVGLFLLIGFAGGLAGKKKRLLHLILAIVALVCAVLHLAMTIVLTDSLLYIALASQDGGATLASEGIISLSYGVPIAILVFTALLTAAAVAETVVCRKK